MTFNFLQAFQKALNVMRKEMDDIASDIEEMENEAGFKEDDLNYQLFQERWDVYKIIVERLDSLI